MISPATIAAVRDRTDIVALIQGSGVALKRRGASLWGLCPFHKEKTGSFVVHPDRGFFYCHGCKENGSAIDFVMKVNGKTFPEAVRELAEQAGIEVEETGTESDRREAAAARKAIEDLYAVNMLAVIFFEGCLWPRPGAARTPGADAALAELERRRLAGHPTDHTPVGEALAAFRLGYAPDAWGAFAAYLQKQGVSPALAEQVGLLVPRKGGGAHYDRFRHRLMFPIFDVMGRCVGFSGRALEGSQLGADDADRDTKPAKYINSPESPVYRKGEGLFGLYQARMAVRQAGAAVLVEGNFDVVSLHAAELRTVVAPLGTAFTEAQARLLKRFAPTAIVLFDGDTAGKKAMRAARGPCLATGVAARAAVLPAGLDPDELVRQGGPGAVQTLVTGARDLLEVLVDEQLDATAFAQAGVQERLARIREVGRLLGEEVDPVARALARGYADRIVALVAGRHFDLGTIEATLLGELRAKGATTPSQGSAPAEQLDPLQLAILGALLDFPTLFHHADAQGPLDLLDGPVALAAAALRGAPALPDALAAMPPALHTFAAARMATPEAETEAQALEGMLVNATKLRALRQRRRRRVVDDDDR